MNQKNKNIYSLIEKHIKLVPLYTLLGLVIILLSSFLYNVGYFCFLDIRLMSFLTLADYYEGTLPFVFMGLLFLTLLFSMLIYMLNIGAANLVIQQIPELILISFEIIKTYVQISYLKLILLKDRNKLKFLFSHKRKELLELSNTNKKLMRSLISVKIKWNKVLRRLLKNLLYTSLFLFIFFVWPILILKDYVTSKELYALMIIVYVIIISCYIIVIKSIKEKIIFYCVVSCITFLLLGLTSFSNSYNKQTLSIYIKNNEKPFTMIRAINKGFVVKEDKEEYFIPSDALEYIKIQSKPPKEKPTK